MKEIEEMDTTIKFDSNQQSAIDAACNLVLSPTSQQLRCIAGRAGRGKTTIIKQVITNLINEWSGIRIVLAAPTGKAAVVINKSIAQMFGGRPPVSPASTVHRMLGCTGPGMWGYSKDFPLEADLIVIDEASMLTSKLLYTVLILVSNGCKVLLLGDHGQLKPVGQGNPFLDLVQAAGPYVSELLINYRQKSGSFLADALENIYNGKMVDFCSGPGESDGKKHDFFLHECENKEKIADALAELVYPMYKEGQDYLCMSPRRTGLLGCEELSLALQERLNPSSGSGTGLKVFKSTIRAGDIVRHNKNSYDLGAEGIFNGFRGEVIYADNKSCAVRYPGWPDDEIVEYEDRKHINCLELGYVVTTHTSQGDQVETAVYVAHRTNFRATDRSNLYVGCSRAQGECHIIGQQDMVKRAIGNRHDMPRNTYLKEMLV